MSEIIDKENLCGPSVPTKREETPLSTCLWPSLIEAIFSSIHAPSSGEPISRMEAYVRDDKKSLSCRFQPLWKIWIIMGPSSPNRSRNSQNKLYPLAFWDSKQVEHPYFLSSDSTGQWHGTCHGIYHLTVLQRHVVDEMCEFGSSNPGFTKYVKYVNMLKQCLTSVKTNQGIVVDRF